MKIGIVGGSGLYGNLPLFDGNSFSETKNYRAKTLEERQMGKYNWFGRLLHWLSRLGLTEEARRKDDEFSVPLVQEGKVEGIEAVFISRHGRGHFRLAHEVKYQATIAALKELGANAVITTSAVGGINPKYSVGDFVVPDDTGEFFTGRNNWVYSPTHYGISPAYDNLIRKALIEAGEELGLPIHDGGSYAIKRGPEFETAKEVEDLEKLGYDMVSMTAGTEAKLAKQVGLPLGTVCIVTNSAQKKGEQKVTDEEVQEIMRTRGEDFIRLLRLAVKKLDATYDICLAKEAVSLGKAKVSFFSGGQDIFQSKKGGVAPLIEALESGKSFAGASAGDTIVGLAAARIFSELHVKRVYAETLSKEGKDFLERAGIGVSFNQLVEKILDPERTDSCPFEKIAGENAEFEEALSKMKMFLAEKSEPALPPKIDNHSG